MSIEQIETVLVKTTVSPGNPTGTMLINKSDLTDDHVLHVEGEVEEEVKTEPVVPVQEQTEEVPTPAPWA